MFRRARPWIVPIRERSGNDDRCAPTPITYPLNQLFDLLIVRDGLEGI